MEPEDFLDTLAARQRAKLWTLEGRLRDIENRAAPFGGAPADDRFGRPACAYAREAVAYVSLIREKVASGEIESATNAALSLGSLWREFELKLEHEPAAHTGKAVRRGLTEARDRTNTETRNKAMLERELLQEAAIKYFGRHPAASLNAAANHAKQVTGSRLRAKTIAQRIRKPPTAQ